MKILLTLISFFYSLCVFAGVAPATQLDQLLQATQHLQADFVQTVNDVHGRSISKSRGRFFLMRPGQFRWEIQQPDKELVIGTGNRIIIYNEELKQVTIKRLEKNLGEIPALLLTQNDIASENHFNVRLDPRKVIGQQWFLLTPKNKNDFFVEIRLGFSHQTLIGMQLRDSLDQITTIQFKENKQNKLLNKNLFQFKLPKDVDVIDETR